MSPAVDVWWPQAQTMLHKSLRLWGRGMPKAGNGGILHKPNGAESP